MLKPLMKGFLTHVEALLEALHGICPKTKNPLATLPSRRASKPLLKGTDPYSRAPKGQGRKGFYKALSGPYSFLGPLGAR